MDFTHGYPDCCGSREKSYRRWIFRPKTRSAYFNLACRTSSKKTGVENAPQKVLSSPSSMIEVTKVMEEIETPSARDSLWTDRLKRAEGRRSRSEYEAQQREIARERR